MEKETGCAGWESGRGKGKQNGPGERSRAAERRKGNGPATSLGSQCSSDRAPPDGEEEAAAAPALVWPPPVCRCKEEIRPQAATLALVWRLPSARPPPQGEAAAAPLRSSASRHTSSPQAEALLPLRVHPPPPGVPPVALSPPSFFFRCCLCRSGATSLPSSTLAGDRGGRREGADRGGAGRARRAAGANRGFPLARCSHLPHCGGAATSPRRPPPKPPPPPRRPAMSSSPETSVFHLRINQGLLDCTNCHRTLRPETYHCRAYTCRQCIRGQIYCRDCIHRHHCLATDTHSTCDLLNNIIAQIKFKCNCNKYIPYCEFLEHQRQCPSAKYSTHPARWRKCILKTSFLQCSECKVPLRPPIFSLWFCNRLICSACYHADLGTYRHCTELEYLLQGITVKCVACKQYLPFSTLGSHQVGDCLKHKLQNIAPDEQETEMGSNSIHGKHKRKAPFEVGKMDKHIVHGDEVGYDDGSCDDNHGTSEDVFSCEDDSVDKVDEGEEIEKPATVKRVAKNAFKTTCDRKAKIAMPYGQKTAQASASLSQRRRITTPRKPPPPRFVPHRPVTRSRSKQQTKC